MIQIYLNYFCFPYSYSNKKSFLTKSSGYIYAYTSPQCSSGSSSTSVSSTCSAYKTNGGTYVQNTWTLGFSYNLPTASPTRAPTYTSKPSPVPSFLPTLVPSTALLGYAYFYAYTIKGCAGSIVAVTAYPLGSCIPQYNATSIKNYIKYSCDSSKRFYVHAAFVNIREYLFYRLCQRHHIFGQQLYHSFKFFAITD